MNEIEELLQEPLFQNFYRICRIPHGSGNETALAEDLLCWAKEKGFSAEKDPVGNVLIRKPASPGCEDAPPVMLQAHLDMVCVKRPGSSHDFLEDPIPWKIEGDWLTTGGETSLGADDGIGVALAMTMLEAEEAAAAETNPADSGGFPELEVLLTVGEEEDFAGASGFEMSRSRAFRLINLDHVEEHEIICGSCGGMRADFVLPVPEQSVPENSVLLKIELSGLAGGHSGEDIHRGRGNAIRLLARLLDDANASGRSYGICALEGGSSRLAIPAGASAVLVMAPEEEALFRGTADVFEKTARRELGSEGKNLKITVQEAGTDANLKIPVQASETDAVKPDAEETESCSRPLTFAEPGPVLDAILLIPDGISEMNADLEGLVDSSDNVGEARYNPGSGKLVLVTEIRAARESQRAAIFRRMQRLADRLGAEVFCSEAYPGWEYQTESRLRDTIIRVHKECCGFEPVLKTVHAGLEVGFFLEKRPGLEAVSIGPDLKDLHSVSEQLSISSALHFRKYLQRLLEQLGKDTGGGSDRNTDSTAGNTDTGISK